MRYTLSLYLMKICLYLLIYSSYIKIYDKFGHVRNPSYQIRNSILHSREGTFFMIVSHTVLYNFVVYTTQVISRCQIVYKMLSMLVNSEGAELSYFVWKQSLLSSSTLPTISKPWWDSPRWLPEFVINHF